MSKETGVTILRDGELIIIPFGATLPPRCIRCNEIAHGKPWKFEFTWNPHGLGMGRSPVALVAVATNRRGKIYGYYCKKHYPKVARNVTIMLAMILVGGIVSVYGLTHQIIEIFGIGCAIAVLGLCSIGWYFAMPSRWLDCQHIEDGKLSLKPISKDFLASFPEQHT